MGDDLMLCPYWMVRVRETQWPEALAETEEAAGLLGRESQSDRKHLL